MKFQYTGQDERTYTFEVHVHHTRPPQVKPPRLPKDSKVEVHIGGQVLSIPLECFEHGGKLIGHTGRPSNGVTTVTLGVVCGKTDGTRFQPVAWASASCSRRDQFCKRTGRELAMARLVDEVLHKDERLGEALGLFLASRGWR